MPTDKLHSRRQFLQTAAAAATTMAAASALAAERAPAVGLGFSLYGMKSLPVRQALRVCAEIGFRDVEFALLPSYPTEPKLLSASERQELRRLLDSSGLRLAALMENLELAADDRTHAANLARLKAAAELAHDLSPGTLPVVETVLGGKAGEWEQRKAAMAERLADWGRVARDGGITLCLKPHVGGAVHLPKQGLWLLDQVGNPAVKLDYDFSHYQLAGLDLGQTLDALLPRTAFIHVKDAAGDATKFQFLLPGEGTVDYADYFRRLKRAGYRGSICVEVSGQIFSRPGYDPVAAAKKCYAALAPAYREAGL